MKILEIIFDCNELVFEPNNEQIRGKLMKKPTNSYFSHIEIAFYWNKKTMKEILLWKR